MLHFLATIRKAFVVAGGMGLTELVTVSSCDPEAIGQQIGARIGGLALTTFFTWLVPNRPS